MECEKSYFKVRIDMHDDDKEDDPGGGEETEEERIERERVEKAAELEGKTVFNEDDMTLDYGKSA